MKPIATYGVGEFRQNATEIIRHVEETATPVQVSRHGKPVVEIRALTVDQTDLTGSVTIVDGVDLTEPVLDASAWSADI